jgi:hypothetical protein
MRYLITVIGAIAAMIGVNACIIVARGADLPRNFYKVSDTPAVPAWSWQQCYISVNGGASTGSQQTGSPTVGGQVGCDYMLNGFVWGFKGTALALSSTVAPQSVDAKSLIDAQVRAGYPIHTNLSFGPLGSITDALIYVQAGVPANFLDPVGGFTAGWNFGGGVEWVIRPCTTSFVEYNFNDIGGRTAHVPMTGIRLRYCGS